MPSDSSRPKQKGAGKIGTSPALLHSFQKLGYFRSLSAAHMIRFTREPSGELYQCDQRH